MSQSRWGINVTEDLGGGLKALVNMENRFTANNGANTSPAFQQSWLGLQGGLRACHFWPPIQHPV